MGLKIEFKFIATDDKGNNKLAVELNLPSEDAIPLLKDFVDWLDRQNNTGRKKKI